MTIEKTVEDFLEPVAVCTGKETLSEVLGTLNHGKPVAVFDKDWRFLMPEAVAGYPPSRRIIDLPLGNAIIIALNPLRFIPRRS